jgi:hypothetical protein
MSISYLARFDTSWLKLPELIRGLETVFVEHGLVFDGTVGRLVSKGGWPAADVGQLEPLAVERMADIPAVAASWFGVNLTCVSPAIAGRIGRGDWMEVDFALFRAGPGRWSLHYAEARRAFRDRAEDDQAAEELYALQVALCANLGFKLSLYDEEDDDLPAVASIAEAEQRIRRATEGAPGCSIVVAKDQIDHRVVGLTSAEYVIFRFLA